MINKHIINYDKRIKPSKKRSEIQKRIEELLHMARLSKVFFSIEEYKPSLFKIAVPNESDRCLIGIPLGRLFNYINGLKLMGKSLRVQRLKWKDTCEYIPVPDENSSIDLARDRNELFWNKKKKKAGPQYYFNGRENYKLKEVAEKVSLSYERVRTIINTSELPITLRKLGGSYILPGEELNKLFPKPIKRVCKGSVK